MSAKAVALCCTALVLCMQAAAQPSDAERKLMNRLMQRVALVSVTDVDNPDAFVADTDPDTLQIVFLPDPNTKPRVTDDGQVVFMNQDLSINDQNLLIDTAIYRKAKRILEGRP